MASDARVHLHVARVEVSMLPPEHIDRHLFTISVEARDLEHDRWAVLRHGQCLSRTGEWDYEPLPSSREDDWKAAHRFGYEDALTLAVEAAPALTINSHRVLDVLAEWEARRDGDS